MTDAVSLNDFVVKAKARRCAVCTSDLRTEIEEGRKNGVSFTMIYEWAASRGATNLSRGGIRYHFDEGHHVMRTVDGGSKRKPK